MKVKRLLLAGVATVMLGIFKGQTTTSTLSQPKLIVGIVVDQMRWDYLYRYYDKYGEDGFKRILNTGFAANNVHIPYVPTYTAVGHASIYTGSIPSINGIVGNDWFERSLNKSVYCTADDLVNPVGTTSRKDGSHSPKNLWSTTITDQLKLATNFQGKVVGVSLKDRASILPAGHSADGAFWFDDSTGNFITSTYYMQELPKWLMDFNKQNYPKQLLTKGWNTLYPIDSYTESSPDNVSWEGNLGSSKAPVFPYNNLSKDYDKDKGIIRTTPFGNTLTLKLAKAAINGYNLGEDQIPDFLTINLASTDYVGHNFGPNSIEVEDTYFRLDKDLAEFFNYLDQKVGKGNYTVFLSADHGGANSIGFLKEHKIPSGLFIKHTKELNQRLKDKFGVDQIIRSYTNFQVYLNYDAIEQNNLTLKGVRDFLIQEIRKDPTILYVAASEDIVNSTIPEPIKSRIINGFNWQRSGDIQVVPRDNFHSAKTGTTHGEWNSYDSHIPALFMGWGIRHGETNKAYHMTDIAPTISALLKIQFPSGTVGVPITEVMRQ